MKKICIIGNSHITALKSAWDNLQSEMPDTEITFFGALAPLLRTGGLVVSEGRLTPSTAELRKSFVQTSGGLEDICGQYDAYLICGLRFGIDRLEDLCSCYRAETHVRDHRAPISDECYLACIKALLISTLAINTLVKVRQITAAPIWVMPMPMPSEERTGTAVDRLAEVGDDQKVRNTLIEVMRQTSDQYGFRLLLQPESTLSRPLKTKSNYTRGALMLSHGMKKHLPNGDHIHMNGDYGSLVLRPWIATLLDSAGIQEDRAAL